MIYFFLAIEGGCKIALKSNLLLGDYAQILGRPIGEGARLDPTRVNTEQESNCSGDETGPPQGKTNLFRISH